MNLRNVSKENLSYMIGLDLGVGSVGWAATDASGAPLSFKGKTAWGSRLFDEASTAANRRMKRSIRRRYDRRKARLRTLQEIMADDVYAVDKNFFLRLQESSLVENDRTESTWGDATFHPLFNEPGYTDTDYYLQYPTIYHLRSALVTEDKQFDIRLVYLALHHIVKHRGHFLYQDQNISSDSLNIQEQADVFCDALASYYQAHLFEHDDWPSECPFDFAAMRAVLLDANMHKADKKKAVVGALTFSPAEKKRVSAIANALMGYKANFEDCFTLEEEKKLDLSQEEEADSLIGLLNNDVDVALFESLKKLYVALLLGDIMQEASGRTISFAKVKSYEDHKKQLQQLKRIIRDYFPKKYNEFFRGEIQGKRYSKKCSGYTAYITNSESREDFYNQLKTLFKTSEEFMATEECTQILTLIDDDAYLLKQRTRENGSIPYQLHQEEARIIVEKQSRYYQTLSGENGKHILSLISFRIPYYVGPLQNNASLEGSNHYFAWSVRYPGMEKERVYPWNFEQIIDKEKSAERFISKMVGDCSYLLGQQALPKNSLLYEEFCLLNELNVVTWAQDGDRLRRLDTSLKHEIIEKLFMRRKTVSIKALSEYLKQSGYSNVGEIKGTQGETGFVSTLSSYNDFTSIIDWDYQDTNDRTMVEDIIKYNAIFEDRKLLKDYLLSKYGKRLTQEQIKKIAAKRYMGWGRLSEELLLHIKGRLPDGSSLSIMDIMREESLNLMEVLSDKRFLDEKGNKTCFNDLISQKNLAILGDKKITIEDVNALTTSPANKRSINQALKVVGEIVQIAGKNPAKICIEFAREEGKKERTTRRYDALYNQIEALQDEHKQTVFGELKSFKDSKEKLNNDALYLYFSQLGKCIYTGKPLNISALSSYDIDHVLPQAYIKDDSLENRVLVVSKANRNKTDNLLVGESVRRKMASFWKNLRDLGLMSEKKYKNLTRDYIDPREAEHFVARQIVETRQIIKHVANLLQACYPDTQIISIRAGLTHTLREALDLPKSRLVNDYHHAHDAYLVCKLAAFISLRYPNLESEFNYAKFMKQVTSMPNAKYGFLVNSFLKTGFDKETGEIKRDAWNAEEEVKKIALLFNRSDCYISRMIGQKTGAFWDETIYPAGSTDAKLPIKIGKKPSVYGGLTNEKAAYYVFFRTVNSREKIKDWCRGIPISQADKLSCSDDIETYFRQREAIADTDRFILLKNHVYSYQKIAFPDGGEYYLPQADALRNARPIVLSKRLYSFVAALEEDEQKGRNEQINQEEYLEAYKVLSNKVCSLCPRLAVSVGTKLQKGAKSFEEYLVLFCEEKDKADSKLLHPRKLILGIVRMLAKGDRANLSIIGGSKNAGGIGFTLRAEDITLIDTSVTGMFERRYKLGL